MPSTSVLSAAVGKIVRASAITEAASSGERSTRPATNSEISASGKIDSSRLYATIAGEAGQTVLIGLAPEGGDGSGGADAHRPYTSYDDVLGVP